MKKYLRAYNKIGKYYPKKLSPYIFETTIHFKKLLYIFETKIKNTNYISG